MTTKAPVEGVFKEIYVTVVKKISYVIKIVLKFESSRDKAPARDLDSWRRSLHISASTLTQKLIFSKFRTS